MNRRFWIALGSLAVAVALGWWWQHRLAVHTANEPSILHPSQKVPSAEAPTPDQINRAPSANQPTPASESKPTAGDPEFQKWVEKQAVEINRTKVDVAKATKEIQGAVAKLTATQKRQLVQTAQDISASASTRIFSIYLLAEAGTKAAEEVGLFLKDPLPTFGESKPHSEAEMRNGQERALRLMAIDGLAARARTDAGALAALESTIPSIRDAYVQAYAKRKLNEVRPR